MVKKKEEQEAPKTVEIDVITRLEVKVVTGEVLQQAVPTNAKAIIEREDCYIVVPAPALKDDRVLIINKDQIVWLKVKAEKQTVEVPQQSNNEIKTDDKKIKKS